MNEYIVKSNQDNLKQELLDTYSEYKMKKGMDGDSKINKKFFAGVKNRILKKKDCNPSISQIDKEKAIEDLQKINLIIPSTKINNNKSNRVDKPMIASSESSKLNINLTIKQIELNFPKDHNEANTKIFKFNFNTEIKYIYNEEAECQYKGLKLIRKEYKVRNSDISLLLFNIDFDIIIFKENRFQYNLLLENMMTNSRIMITNNSYIILEKEKVVNTTNILIEPINLVIGFRQLIFFMGFYEKINLLRTELSKNYLSNENEKILIQKTKFIKKLAKINIKLQNQTKYNTTTFNNFNDINLKIEKLTVRLIDNTEFYDVPLAKLNIYRIDMKAFLNSDPVDYKNMGLYIIEMISGKKTKNYNIYNLYQHCDCSFKFDVFLYNQILSDWDLLVEPWKAEIKVFQVAKMTRLKLDIKSNDMFNINITINMMKVMNEILKKIGQNESKWINRKISKNAVKDEFSNDVIEFYNLLGIPITLWFNLDSENKIVIDNDQKISFTQNELDKINAKFSSKDASLNKNKFSLFIGKQGGKDNLIENIDFSVNNYQNYKVKINEKQLEIFLKIRNSGLIKNVYIESNIYFRNNTIYKMNLRTIKKSTKFNPILADELEDSNKYSTNEIIEPGDLKKIPIAWLESPHLSFLSIQNEDFTKNEKLLFTDFNFIFRMGMEFQKYSISDNENEKNKILSHMKTFNKIISFRNSNNEQIDIVADILVLGSTLNDKITPSNYCIALNPPLLLFNSLPFRAEFKSQNHDTTKIDPTQDSFIYNSNIYEKQNLVKLGLYYLNKTYIETKEFSFFDKDSHYQKEKNIKTLRLYSSQDQNQYKTISIKYEDFDFKLFYNSTFVKCAKLPYLSQKIVLYVDFLILNKLDTMLYIKSSDQKAIENQLNQTIIEKKLNIYFIDQEINQVNLKLGESDWSQNLDVSIKGIEAHLTFENVKVDSEKESNISVVFTSTNSFPFSTLIILEPNYLLINKLPFDIFYRQGYTTENLFSPKDIISFNSSKPVHFTKSKNGGNELKLIQFSLLDNEEIYSEGI